MSKPSGNPYIGPRTFQKDEGHLFYGREREARDLIALVASERLVVFYAQSGAGKSSIVNTRLIPNLETKEYEVLPVGRVGGDAPEGVDVANIYIYNLLRSLEQHESDPAVSSKLSLADFLAHLNSDAKGFFYDASMVEVITEEEEDVEIVKRALVIDQFEELFSTHPEAWEKRDDFFLQLSQAMEKDPYLWVVLVMREDFIASLDPYAHYLENGLRVRYYMQRLEREAALKAVKSPVAGIRPYAEGVAEKLIDDLCSITVQRPDGELDVQPGQYVEPVQMQVVCYGLWDNLSPEGTQITEKDLQEVGDVNQSLGKYYNKRVGEVAKAKNVRERLIREWFERKLIAAGGIRNMVLQERETKPGELHDDVIQALQSDLVRAEKRGGATWYELTHDRLVEPILERNKVWFEEHLSPLQRQAALWNNQNRQESWLLSDHALVEMEVWAGTHKDDLTDVEKEYLAACQKLQIQINERQAAERQRLEMAQKLADEQARAAKRARIFNIVLAVLIVIAFITSLNANQQKAHANEEATKAANAQATARANEKKAQEQSNKARSVELSFIALEQADSQLDLAVLLGLEADSLSPENPRVQQTLLALLQKSSRYDSYKKMEEQIQQIQYTPDSETFVMLDKKGITFWNSKSQKQLNESPLNEHFGPVTALTLSKDGRFMASGGLDGTIVIWDVATRKRLSEPFPAHNGRVRSLAFSPDGKVLASESDAETNIILWNMNDRSKPSIIRTLQSESDSTFYCITFSPDGKTLAAGDGNGTITLWDVGKPETVGKQLTGHEGPVFGVAFASEGNVLASGSYDDTVILWDVRNPNNPRQISKLSEHPVDIETIAVSPDGKMLASGDDFGNIFLWDIEKRKSITSEPLNGNPNWVISLAFSPDGKILAAGYAQNGSVILWDVEGKKIIDETIQAHKASVWGVAFDREGKTLISGSEDSTIRLWDVSNVNNIGSPLLGHPGQVTGMRLSPDGKLLESYGNDGTLLFDVETLTLLGQGYLIDTNGDFTAYLLNDENGEKSTINIINSTTGSEEINIPVSGSNFYFSPDGRILFYETNENLDPGEGKTYINLWDVSERILIGKFEGTFIGFNPDNNILIYQTSNDDGDPILNFLDIGKSDVIASLPYSDIYYGPIVNQNATILAYGSQESEGDKVLLKLVDTATGETLPLPNPIEISDPNFVLSNNGKILLYSKIDPTNGNQTINALDTKTGNHISSDQGYLNRYMESGPFLIYEIYNYINGETAIRLIKTTTGEVVLSQKGTYFDMANEGKFLAYSNGTTVELINTTTGEVVLSQKGTYFDMVNNGDFLVFSDEKGINVFDITHRRTISEPIKGVYLGISPDGQSLVTGNEDNSLFFWNLAKTWPLGEPIDEKTDLPLNAVLNPDGQTLAWIGKEGVVLQDIASGKVRGQPFNDHFGAGFPGAYPTIIPGKNILVVGTNDDTNSTTGVTLWDLSTGKQIGKEFPGFWAVPNPDGSKLAIGDYDTNRTQLWDLKTGEQIGNDFPGNVPSFSSDGTLLAVGDFISTTTRVWDLKSLDQPETEFTGSWPYFNPDGKLLAVGDYETTTIKIWDLNTGKQIGNDYPGNVPSFSPNGKLLAAGSESSSTTTLWDLNTGDQIGNEFPGSYISFSPDSELLAVGNYSTSTTTLWNLNTMEQIGSDFLNSWPSFGSDDKFLALGDSNSSTTTIWDLSDEKHPVQFRSVRSTPPTSIVFSTDGKTLASFASDGIVLRNLIKTNEFTRLAAEKYTDTGHQITSIMSFYADDTRFAALGDDGTLITWDLDSEKPATGREWDQKFKSKVITPIFSPDGKYLVYEQEKSLKIWDVAGGLTYSSVGSVEIPASNYDKKVTFSPDGAVIAFSYGTSINFYDFPKLTKLGGKLSTDVPVRNLNFITDNDGVRYLITFDYSGNSQMWDWTTRTKVGDPMSRISFIVGSNAQDNSLLYFDTSGKLIKFNWDFNDDSWENLLCPRVKRNLTQEEWHQYLPGIGYQSTCPAYPTGE